MKSRYRPAWLVLLLLACALLITSCGENADDDDDATPDDDQADDDAEDDDSGDDDDLPPPGALTLSWISSRDGRLVDEYGRQWLARGINARVTGLFDGDEYWSGATAEFEQADAAQMAALGFNMLRLCINWSGLEPIEGEISSEYLERIDRVVDWAAEAGLYVLIDFHQDKFSKYIGDDGAPRWAIYPPLPEGPDPLPELARIGLAYISFFNDVEGIQYRFLPAWRAVVGRYADRPEVVGFEVINEPNTSMMFDGRQRLYAFYEICAPALRELDQRHALWLEPDVLRNKILRAPLRDEPFPDDNVVYEPHFYPNFEGMAYQTAAEWIEATEWSFEAILAETESWGATPVIGEWGTHPADSIAPALFEAVQQMAEQRNIGLTFWVWKEKSSGNWGLFDYDAGSDAWTLRSGPGMDALIRPGALAVPGVLLAQSLDVESGALSVEFTTQGNEGPPLLFAPERWYPDGFALELDGAAVDYQLDSATSRILVAWDGRPGRHTLLLRRP